MKTPIQWDEFCLAPAKVNAFLHIIEQQPDGYHRLQTVFRLIGLYDRLRFFPRQDGLVRLVSETEGITQENDLASRAARLLQAYSHTSQGVDIEIQKHIPMGAGLGGGSSNAATTLLALNALWKTGLDRVALQALGRQLGADVPFFIFGEDAFADGIGDDCEAIVLPTQWFVVLFPPVFVSTAQIFNHPTLQRSHLSIEKADYKPGYGMNMLTPVADDLFPIIGEYLEWLAQFGDARMSGSGSTVFAAFEDQETAQAVFEQRPVTYEGVVVSSIQYHPMRDVV